MLIIFDLDDTLIDTAGCITHYKLADALQAMCDAGLVVPVYSDALELLRRLDRYAESAGAALSEFHEVIDCDKKFLEIGVKEVYGSIPDDLPIFPLEGALSLLTDLAHYHQLALVTVGKNSQQMQKLQRAGIDSRLFSKIVVVEEKNKKPHYQMIVEELGYSAAEVLVCGDRIAIDLTPARELGFKTVQMQWGRGLHSAGNKADVDYHITDLGKLREIVDTLITFSAF